MLSKGRMPYCALLDPKGMHSSKFGSIFSLFDRFLEENEAFLEVSGLKSRFGKKLEILSM